MSKPEKMIDQETISVYDNQTESYAQLTNEAPSKTLQTYDIGARQASFSDINSEDLYDGVWASFSLLHATRADFPQILDALQKALKTNGWFHLTMKLGSGEKRDKLGRFYTYYSEDELSNYLTTAGFSIDSIATGEAMSLAGVMEPWIIILSQKPITLTESESIHTTTSCKETERF